MSNPWFRMYHEFADDPKVQMMPEVMQRRLVMLFCERCKGETFRETERVFHWRISAQELAETKTLFIEKGFIEDDWTLVNWDRRQFLSDTSTERVRKFRERKRQSAGREFVYYAVCGDRVKIGYSENPWSRMAGLKTEFPTIKLIALEYGNVALERKRHFQFGSLWIEGEWFHHDGELKIFIESLGQLDLETGETVSVTPGANAAKQNVTPQNRYRSRTEAEQKQKPPLARSVPPEELAGTLPLVDGTEYLISKADLKEWAFAFPGIVVRTELAAFKAWLNANPTRKKTPRGIRRAIVSWLSRAQDKSHGTQNGAKANGRIENNLTEAQKSAANLGLTETRYGDYSGEVDGNDVFSGSGGDGKILYPDDAKTIEGKL